MKHFLFAAAALSLTGVISLPAHAGEGNGDPFPPATGGLVVANPATPDTGSQAYPAFAGAPATVTTGGVLASNGQETIVQSANSLPPGWANGTADEQYAQSVNRYYAQQANRRTQTAQVPTAGPRG